MDYRLLKGEIDNVLKKQKKQRKKKKKKKKKKYI